MNLYWSVFKNLEKELITLSNQIHFDDKQLAVYSVKISELLIRCSVEIESIAKDLFLANGGQIPSDSDLYFDTDCLELLESKWSLSAKQVVVSAQNFYFSHADNQILTPLNKANKRGTSGADWKKAYQAVKHNRTFSLSKGNLKHLIRAMAALYLLNVYYKNDNFELDKDNSGSTFDERLDSEIFSIKLHANTSISADGAYTKNVDFDECVYLLKTTDETAEAARESIRKIEEKSKELTTAHMLKKIEGEIQKATDLTPDNAQSKIEAIVKNEKERVGSQFFVQAARTERSSFSNLKYEAVINTNQF